MFKYLFEFILIVIIIFFVWNILKRLFLSTFYPNMLNQNNKQQQKKQDNSSQNKKNQNLNWDAETVDYEEIKDETKQQK